MALVIARGDKRWIGITIREDGVAKNITGYTVFFTAKAAIDNPGGATPDSAAIIARTITSHSDPTNGKTGFFTTEAETATSGKYYWDVQVKNAAGVEIISIPPQLLVIQDDVTRRTS